MKNQQSTSLFPTVLCCAILAFVVAFSAALPTSTDAGLLADHVVVEYGPIHVGNKVMRSGKIAEGEDNVDGGGIGVVLSLSRGKFIVQWDNGEWAAYSEDELNPVFYKATFQEGDEVVRGPGWTQGDHDGGAGGVGKVVAKMTLEMVQVKWEHDNRTDWYLGGSDGKFDLLLVRRSPSSA